jgi:hypothetical protein
MKKILSILCMVSMMASCGNDGNSKLHALLDSSGEMPGEEDLVEGDTSGLPDISTTCYPGDICDDGNPCTSDDTCSKDAVCEGILFSCDDDLDCTQDLCLPDGTCDNPLRSGWCYIEEECYEDGDVDESNPCLECITAVSQDEWSADDGNDCTDDNGCSINDHCESGVCIGLPMNCPEDTECAHYACQEGTCVMTALDGECTGDACATWTCDEGECVASVPVVCEDDNLCTDDICDPQSGCKYVPNSEPCDDNNPCTADDACGAGSCQPGGNQLICDDDNPCTDDSCHPELGCLAFPNVATCDDGDPCLGGDICIGGACQPGVLPLTCDDENICTDDYCEPFSGCTFEPNIVPCDDGDECFAGDVCLEGECSQGPTSLDCDDSNDCTLDACEPFLGCYHQPIEGNCSDDNLCTTDDTCFGGECIGTDVECLDDNLCTTEACDPLIGCVFSAINSKECRPKITITYPPRAVTLDGDPEIVVTGTVTSIAGAITNFVINGEAVSVLDDGTFAHPFTSQQGMNLIVAEAEDEAGGTGRTTPSFYFSTKYYSIDHANPQQGMVPDGIMAFLGPEVWDDNNTGDVDDMATIMTLYLNSMDLTSLITNPVHTDNLLWCTYTVDVNKITYGDAQVDLAPMEGGLNMSVIIPDFSADIYIETTGFLCGMIDSAGHANATSLDINAKILIWMEDGVLKAAMQDTTVSVNNLEITLDGSWGFLLNWLIGFFEGQFSTMLEDQFKNQLGDLIPSTIVDALNSMALDQNIPMSPFFGDGPSIMLQLKTALNSVAFGDDGAALGLKATVVTPKGVDHTPLGSIGRAACLSGVADPFTFPKLGQLEISLHDDFFNQLSYGMYWGGLLQMDVDPAELGVDLGGFGLTDVTMAVDFLLPAIMTSCVPDETFVMQIGDLRVDGTMKMAGQPVTMTVYASLEVEAYIIAVDNNGTKELSATLGDLRTLEVEVTEITGPLAGAESVLVALIEENLIGALLDSFSGGGLGSFPIPDIDLSGFDPSIPPGSNITLDLKSILRSIGYTILSGGVK